MARDPKHDILFEPDPDRPEDDEEPLLPDPALQRFRVGEADEPGVLPRDEGGRRLRSLLHRVLLDLARVRRHPPGLGAPLGRRRHQEPLGHVRHAPRARRAGRLRALVRRPARALHGDALRPERAVADPERLRVPDLLHRDGQGRHPLPPAALRRRRQAGADGRLRHRLRLRLALLPPAAVPDAVLQQAHRRVRRLVREPRPLLARDDRAGEGGRRRRHRDLRAAVLRHVPGRARHAARARRRPVRPACRPPRRRLGHQPLRHLRMGRGRDALALLPAGPRDPLAEAHQGGHEEARARRRPLHEPRRDGRGDRERLARHHRHLPPLDLRPVPPPEDRRGPPRRHPRVHRLQHLHLPLGDRRPAPHLHAERDRGRGVPARLASGEVRAGRERRQRRARRRRRPGRHGVRDRARQARHAPRAPRRGAGRHGRDHALDPPAARPRRMGPRRQLPAASRSTSSRTSSSSRTRSSTRRASPSTAPRS